MSGKLKNKIALITGGSAGIGKAIAQLFAAEGAKVIITGRNQQTLTSAAEEIDNGAIAIQADSSNLTDLERLYETIGTTYGKIDILVANAAIYVVGPLAQFTEEMFDRQSSINFKGTFFTVQKAMNYLQEGASVILLSSVGNQMGAPHHASYAATKAAIRSMGRSFATELLPQNIKVNVLTPGPVDTDVFDQVTTTPEEKEAFRNNVAALTPLKRLGRKEEIAAGALFLATEGSGFMLGAELLMDGGIRGL